MGLQYTNRRGDTYYLQAGTTRTGKPKYYTGRKLTGTPLDAVPDGYEIHESPEHGQVHLRKIKPTAIAPSEVEQVRDGIRHHGGPKHVIVDVDGDSLIVYVSAVSESAADSLFAHLGGPLFNALSSQASELNELFASRGHYTKMLRFELVDPDRRLFNVERWCFLGSIDDWFFLEGGKPLADLVKKYAKHLGKDSFYELM